MFHESIKRRIQKLGIKNGEFAALVGISAPALSQFLRGRMDLPDPKRLDVVLQDLEELKTCFPIPLGLHDAKLLSVALERFREGKFKEFSNVTRKTDWSVTAEDQEYMEKHYPRLWNGKSKGPQNELPT